MNPARTLAFRSLCKTASGSVLSTVERDEVLQSASLSARDEALYNKLFFGVLEKKIPLDFLIARLVTTPLDTLDLPVLCLLESGLYQILYLNRIPDHAAIDETVSLAKHVAPAAQTLVNAVLRHAADQKDDLFSLLNLPGVKGLSVRYGYPRYLVKLWNQAYGADTCLSIMNAQNTPPPLTVRVNTLCITKDEYLLQSKERGILFSQSPLCENALICQTTQNPRDLYGYDEGFFFVQDAAAQQAIESLGAQSGERILDLCSAPGGKSFSAALAMQNTGCILSMDLSEKRLKKVSNGARRLGLSIIQTRQNDATVEDTSLIGAFDRVICDVPCSGFGVIAKKPDIRQKKQADLADLYPLQKSILDQAGKYVRRGGVLLYATCTLNPAENEEATDSFLEKNPHFHRLNAPRTVFPVGGENDGFFYDLLEKTDDPD